MQPYVHHSITHSAKTWRQLVSLNGWLDKEDIVHIYNGILARRKEEIKPKLFSLQFRALSSGLNDFTFKIPYP